MVESACGLGCLVLGWFLGSSFLSPPSVFSSLPSTMTWAPCPHGVRTRGKKIFMSGAFHGRAHLRCHSAPPWNLSWCDIWPTLDLWRMPRLSTSNCDTTHAAAKKGLFSSKTRVYPMSGIMCSQGGHRIAGQMAKSILFSIDSSPLLLSWHLGKPAKDSAI